MRGRKRRGLEMAAAAEEIHVEVLNAVNGEPAASFRISSEAKLTDLHQRVGLGQSARPVLLTEGQELCCDSRTLSAAGLHGNVQLTLVWKALPAEWKALGLVHVSGEGYHPHDTRLAQVPSTDAAAFYLQWRRQYNSDAGSFHGHMDAIRARARGERGPFKGKQVHEEAVVNALERQRRRLSLWLVPCPSGRARRTVAMVNGQPLLHVPQETATSHTFELAEADGHVWWRGGGFGELQLEGMWLATATSPVKILARGERRDTHEVLLLKGLLDVEARGISFEQCRELEGLPSFREMRFVGSDRKGQFLFHIGESQLACVMEDLKMTVLPLPAAPDFGIKDSRRQDYVHAHYVLDPQTEDLYLIQDVTSTRGRGTSTRGRSTTPNCLAYRLRRGDGEDIDFAATYELICAKEMSIDGFSDSFCVAVCSYHASSDSILVFDAGDELWSLDLHRARHQEAIELPSDEFLYSEHSDSD